MNAVDQSILDMVNSLTNTTQEDKAYLAKGIANQSQGYMDYSKKVVANSGLDNIVQTENQIMGSYLNELKDAPGLDTLKRKYKSEVDVGDIDYTIKKMIDQRDSIYANLVKDANKKGITVNPLELMQVAKQQESIMNSQINDLTAQRKARFTSAEDYAQQVYDSKMQKMNLLKESLKMVEEQKNNAMELIKEGKADYKYLADYNLQIEKINRDIRKEEADMKFKTLDRMSDNYSRIKTLQGDDINTNINTTRQGSKVTNRDVGDKGLDLDVQQGEIIPIPVGGKIAQIDKDKNTGNVFVKIRSTDGKMYMFNHLNEKMLELKNVYEGQNIEAGTDFLIGGNTGNVKGMVNGKYVRLRKDGKVQTQDGDTSYDGATLLSQGKGSHIDVRIFDEKGNLVPSVTREQKQGYLSMLQNWNKNNKPSSALDDKTREKIQDDVATFTQKIQGDSDSEQAKTAIKNFIKSTYKQYNIGNEELEELAGYGLQYYQTESNKVMNIVKSYLIDKDTIENTFKPINNETNPQVKQFKQVLESFVESHPELQDSDGELSLTKFQKASTEIIQSLADDLKKVGIKI